MQSILMLAMVHGWGPLFIPSMLPVPASEGTWGTPDPPLCPAIARVLLIDHRSLYTDVR